MVNVFSTKFPRGLDVNSNQLVAAPGKDAGGGGKNACTIADNCVLTRQRSLGNRRGFSYFTNPTSARIDGIWEYQSQLIEHQTDNTLWAGNPTDGTRTQYSGTYAPPPGVKMDTAVSQGQFYFTSSDGVYKLDTVSGTPSRAGMPRALSLRASVAIAPNGFLGGFRRVGYHVTWLRLNSVGQETRSDVSPRIVVTNTNQVLVDTLTASPQGLATATTDVAHPFNTGDLVSITGVDQAGYNGDFPVTKTGATTFTYQAIGKPVSPATSVGFIYAGQVSNVTLTFVVPLDITTADWFEVWRTIQVDATNPDPGDTCYLVAKVQNTTASLSTVSYTDTMSDDLLVSQTPLYTNPTQDGPLAGNSRPPMSTCVEVYKDYTLYGNASIDSLTNMNMLAVINFTVGTSAIKLTDSAGTRTYTLSPTEDLANQKWQKATGPSNAQNIENTTRSLCAVISSDPVGRWYAAYTAGPTDNPGVFMIWARRANYGLFWMTADSTTTGNQFAPVIPATGNSLISTNDYRMNRLFYSKPNQPEAVPLLNYIDVGRRDQPILKLVSCRDCCIIVKADGLWYLSGLDAPFSLVELDATCRCVAAETAIMLNNMLYMLSNQGIVKVSLSGVTVISFDIEPLIMTTTIRRPNLASVAFAVAHEADRAYYLFIPEADSDTIAPVAYVYHTFIEEWTKWLKPAAAGYVHSTNYLLYLSSGLENALLRQRKNGDVFDFSDEEVPISIPAVQPLVITTALNVTWSSTVFQPVVGMTVHQGSEIAKVIAVSGSGTVWSLTLDRPGDYTSGAATVRMPIQCHVRLSPQTLGEVGVVKTIYNVAYVLERNTVTSAAIEVGTNEASAFNTYPVTRNLSGGWGLSPWGATVWGDTTSPIKTVPWQVDLPVPDLTGETVTSGWYHAVSTEQFIISQIAVEYEQIAEYESVAA